jgi:phosphoglycerol geranylgeranyltransferase
MVGAVKHAIDKGHLIVGGGIRDRNAAAACAKAGADMIVTGTAVEDAGDVRAKIAEFVSAIKS